MRSKGRRALQQRKMAKSALAVALLQMAAVTTLLLQAARCSSPKLLNYRDVRDTSGEGGYTVSYDNRSFIIGGQRVLLLSGAVHYPRVDAGEWRTVLRLMYEDGLNAVQTYLYWNLHQSERGGQYDLSGNKNWLKFVQEARDAGLFVVLRIGPFVASEWDYGKIANCLALCVIHLVVITAPFAPGSNCFLHCSSP